MTEPVVPITPTVINLRKKSRLLEIAFADGLRLNYPCEYLRVPDISGGGTCASLAQLRLALSLKCDAAARFHVSYLAKKSRKESRDFLGNERMRYILI